MPKVTLLCGPAGAGKTTYARKLEQRGAVRLSMDEAVWDDGWRQDEPPQERLDELYAGLRQTFDRALAGGTGVSSELLVFTAPFEVLWQRVKRRNDEEHANAVRLTESRLRLYVDGFDWPAADEGAQVISTG